MSTRCHIIVKENNKETFIYHHHDGYPSGVGAELEGLLAKCEHANDFNDLAHRIELLGGEYEIDGGIHGDEDFIYTIIVNNDSCILRCDQSYPNKMLVYEQTYKKSKYNKEELLKIYNMFDKYGLIRDDLSFDPEHFIETVIMEQLNKEEDNG